MFINILFQSFNEQRKVLLGGLEWAHLRENALERGGPKWQNICLKRFQK